MAPVTLDETLCDRSILVTGGTGSFGRAFVARALKAGAARVCVFSRDELKQAEMAAQYPGEDRLRFFLGDVRDPNRLKVAMYSVEDVIHAAAMKRIDACEADPGEAIATNITGTQNVAHAAIEAGVERAVFLSTDKAPAACTLYGMTKAVAERLWCQSNVYAAGTGTILSATRYGNVLGSRGSVLDVWRGQRDRGEPLTVTDERATRFWMTIDDAVDLVERALDDMRGGEVFIPKVPSAPILDLARAVVESDGVYVPGHVETGLRAGERLHETLISEEEARTTHDLGTHYEILPTHESWCAAPRIWDATRVAPDFSYRSDTNPERASIDELRRMIA